MRIILADAGLGPLADWLDVLAGDYASGFSERGHDVLLLCRGGERTGQPASSSFRVWRYPAPRTESVSAAFFSAWAAAAIARWRPDAVLAVAPSPEGLVIHALSRVLPCRYATMVHSAGDLSGPCGRTLARGLESVFDRSQFVIAASGFTRDTLAMLGVPRDRIGVVNPGAAFPGAEPAVPSPRRARRESLVIGSAGPIVRSCRHDMTIRAMPRILKEFPHAEYRIVGDGPEEHDIEALAESLNVRHGIRLLGRYDRQVEAVFRNGLDVFVAVSDNDGGTAGAEGLFGLIDAAAAGVPCVGTRSGSIPELVIHGETGLIIEPDSPEALAEAVCRMARDEPMRRRMGEAAAALAASRFRRTAQVDIVLDWFLRLGPLPGRRSAT